MVSTDQLSIGLKVDDFQLFESCKVNSCVQMFKVKIGIRTQSLIRRYGGESSMSRPGNCWDNAAMESFFSRLKVELGNLRASDFYEYSLWKVINSLLSSSKITQIPVV